MDLELRHLRLVRAIVADGSLTRAGETLHLSQSALSHQLCDIESRLGVSLFRRLGRRLLLTPAGEHLLPAAREILDRIEHAEAAVRDFSARRGPLRITVETYTCYHWLPELVRTYRIQHADIDVRIEPAGSVDPIRSLLDGSVDIAIVARVPDDPRLVARPLLEDRVVLVVPPDHSLTARRTVSPRDFANERLFTVPAGGNQPAGGGTTLVLIDALLDFVRAGLGVAVAPQWTVDPYVRDGLVSARAIEGLPVWRWTAAIVREAADRRHILDFTDLLVRRSRRWHARMRERNPGRTS
jgi:LysR family transcriptional regulator for metE and metH